MSETYKIIARQNGNTIDLGVLLASTPAEALAKAHNKADDAFKWEGIGERPVVTLRIRRIK